MAKRVVETLVTEFVSDHRSLLRGFDQGEQRAETFAKRVSKKLGDVQSVLSGKAIKGEGWLPALSNISNIIQGIPQIGHLASALVSPLTNAAEAGIKFNAFMETAEIGFTGMLGSGEKAKRFLDELQGFAEKTPFEFTGLVKSSRYMSTFGFSMDEVIPKLTTWGNVISATGDISEEALEGIVRGFGQMRIKGKASLEEINQLSERGFPAIELLAKAIGKTDRETIKLIESGKVKGKEAVEAITAMAEADPRFAGQMDQMSRTLAGRLSNLEDIKARALGQAMRGTTVNLSDTLGDALSQGDLAMTMAKGFDSALSPASAIIKASVKGVLGGGITSGLTEGIDAGKSMVQATVTGFALDAVISPFKSMFGINSPSTVMIEMGNNLMFGLAQGIQEGGEGVRRTLREQAEALLSDPRVRAMLDTIAFAEGADYRTKVGGGDQGNLTRKNRSVVNLGGGLRSSASGRYQFLNKTWDSAAGALGLSDFSPRSQDLAAIELLRRRGALNPLLNNDFGGAVHAARKEWASFPGAGYGQGERSMSALQRYYTGSLNALNGGMAGGAGASFSAGNPVPVRVTNIQELGFSPPAGAIQLNKKPVYENGKIVGYDTFDQAEESVSNLSKELPVINHSMEDWFKLMPPLAKVTEEVGLSAAKGFMTAEEKTALWYDRVVGGANEASTILGARVQDITGSFQESFSSVFSNWEGGFSSMASRMVLTWGQSVAEMILRAQSARLSEALFGGFEGGKSTGGGLLGGFLKILGIGAGAAAGGALTPTQMFGQPYFAEGGNYPANMPRITGEKGVELDFPRASGQIISNKRIREALGERSASGGHTTIQHNTFVLPPPPVAPAYVQRRSQRDVAEMIARRLR